MHSLTATGARLVVLATLITLVHSVAGAAPRCLNCHEAQGHGFSSVHRFAATGCSACHAGDPATVSKSTAHRGLIAAPGRLHDADRACGRCHAAEVRRVRASLMHTGGAMVRTTRAVFGELGLAQHGGTLATLGHSPADSLLRKLCAGCHLGQPGPAAGAGDARHRGGGCLACHLRRDAAGGHPALTVPVGDDRCFGCHSRSGRIALSYAGLAEQGAQTGATRRLADGRAVELMAADVHHAAGMGCTDCHTARGLMGTGDEPADKHQAVDIRCDDCHRRPLRRVALHDWPPELRALLRHVPFPTGPQTEFPATARGTPLWHIEMRGDTVLLHRKDGGGVIAVPPYRDASHPLRRQHARLDCAACHSRWAPQCYGCHLEYDAGRVQWDHLERAVTPGRWRERRGAIRNAPPPLGVTADDRIVPVVPAMILTAEHPAWASPRFIRRFAALAPHTLGRARSCASCHRSPVALGLGQGRLLHDTRGWRFEPAHPRLNDGLPADAWTRLDGVAGRPAGPQPVRPLSGAEIRRILDAPLDAEPVHQHPSSGAGGGGGAVGGVKAGG